MFGISVIVGWVEVGFRYRLTEDEATGMLWRHDCFVDS